MKIQNSIRLFAQWWSQAFLLLLSVTFAATSTSAQNTSESSDVANEEEIFELDIFEINSYASQQAEALSQQRAADILSNVLAADSIGALPDTDLRMALNRLPGVNVAGGDAGQVSIRGMQGKLNAVTLDGNALPSAAINLSGYGSGGDDRGVDLMKIPAEAIQGLEVIKTPTADMDGDSIGGRVDLKTKSAFDYEYRILNAGVEFENFEFGGSGYSTNFTYGDRLDEEGTVGLFITANWKDFSREFGQTNIDSANADEAAPGVPNVIEQINPNQQLEESEQFTTSGSLDWRVSDNSMFRFKGWYNNRMRSDGRPRVQVILRDADEEFMDSTGLISSGTGEVRVRKRGRYRPDRDYEQLRFSIENETTFGNSVLETGALFGQSDFSAHQYEYRFEARFRRDNEVDWVVDRTNDPIIPAYSFSAVSGVDMFNDPSQYGRSEFSRSFVENFDETTILYADLTTELETELPISLKTGFKGTYKDAGSDGIFRAFSGTDDVTPEVLGIRDEPFSTYGQFEDFGFTLDARSYSNFIEANQDNEAYFEEEYEDGAEEQLEGLVNTIKEDITAVYFMGTVDFDKLRLIGGARHEDTDASYGWPASTADRGDLGFPDVSNDKSYGTWVPSLLGVYRFNENDILRMGWSRTLARPDWEHLIPIDQSITLAVIDPDELIGDTVVDVEINNPGLNAQRSNNIDLSYEHYYSYSSLVSIGYFYKEMDNYVGAPIRRLTDEQAVNSVTGELLFTDDGEPVFYRIGRPENGVTQSVNGWEFLWNHRFNNLPGLLDGLGFTANATFITGDYNAPLFDDPANPLQVTGSVEYDRLEDQARELYRATIYWERQGFSARLGYYQNGSQIAEFGRFAPDVHYVRSELSSVDAKISYQWKNGLRVFIEGANLSGEPEDARYANIQDFYQTYDRNGRRYRFGGRWEF